MTEILSREQVETSPTTWIVASDNSGLGMEDCGCGKTLNMRIVQSRGAALEVIFYHDSSRCMMAFLRNKDFEPLTYEMYLALFPAVEGDAE